MSQWEERESPLSANIVSLLSTRAISTIRRSLGIDAEVNGPEGRALLDLRAETSNTD